VTNNSLQHCTINDDCKTFYDTISLLFAQSSTARVSIPLFYGNCLEFNFDLNAFLNVEPSSY